MFILHSNHIHIYLIGAMQGMMADAGTHGVSVRTKRLLIRDLRLDDAPEIFLLMSSSEVLQST